MTITKFGHSCFLVQEAGARILTDPGVYSTVPTDLASLDAIVLTHEHPDHTDPETLQRLLSNSPSCVIYTNAGVGAVLTKESIPFSLVEDGQSVDVRGVSVEGIGTLHETITPELARVANTGYLIGKRFFTPGDAFTDAKRPIEILALPIVAPWSKFSETLSYVEMVKPKLVIAAHDGFLTPKSPFRFLSEKMLPAHAGEVRFLEIGQPTEL